MYKPLAKDPKCCFSISLPISMLKNIEEHLDGKSRSEFIKDTIIYWFNKKKK